MEAPSTDQVAQTRLVVVRQLAARILQLESDLDAIARERAERLRAQAPACLQLCGVGPVVAARLLGELGCQPRIHSAAALAALAGIAPVAVSSAGRQGHRVNYGGNRQLNRVFHVIALSQLRCEPRAKASYDKKRAEGKTARAAMRCLTRRLVDVVSRLLRAPSGEPVAVPT